MAASVSKPAARASQPGGLGWLPAGGNGKGLNDHARAPVLVISEQAVARVLEVLQAALAAGADHGWLADADLRAFEAIRERRTETATRVARAVSALAEPAVVYPVLALAGSAAARRGRRWRAAAPFLVVVDGAAVRRRLSQAIARPRPPADAWLAEPEGFSFPSKHTTLAAMAAGASMQALGLDGVPARAASLLAAATVGASRVYLGVHWPTDVAAGWVFAEGWLCLTHPD